MVEHSIIETVQGGATLDFPKQWEAAVFATPANSWSLLKKVEVPTLVLRGDDSDVITINTWRKLLANYQKKNITYKNLPDCGHLLPLEKPDEVGQAITHFLLNK